MGILSGIDHTSRCADSLKNAGFTREEISLMSPDEYGAQEMIFGRRSKALEGFAVGTIAGAIMGAIFGYVASDLRLVIPGLMPIISAGNLLSALSMATIGGAILGIFCAIIGASLNEFFVRKFDRKNILDNTLIAVHVDNNKEAKVAARILRDEGAVQVRSLEEEKNRKRQVYVSPAH
jgi:hypothetical protein